MEWNTIFPNLKIPLDPVLTNWGITDTSFYFAPADGSFGNIQYQAGFGFSGKHNPHPSYFFPLPFLHPNVSYRSCHYRRHSPSGHGPGPVLQLL